MKRSLLDAIVLRIEAFLSDPQCCLSDKERKEIQNQVEDIKHLLSQSLLRSGDNQPQDCEWHQSPFVLSLSLASDVGKYSASDPRKNGKHSANLSAIGQNWGQLSGFLDYLSDFKFLKSHITENGKTKGSYWPGLPTCVMALVPLETLYRTDSRIMISASLDRFEYSQDLQTLITDERVQRLTNLETECSEIRKEQIYSVKSYSEEMRTEYEARQLRITRLEKSLEDTKKRVGQEKKQAYDAVQDAKSEKTKITTPHTEQDLAQLVEDKCNEKKATDQRTKKEVDDIKEEINALKEQNPPDAGNANVPVYLPVIISTWHPDGTYLPTCFLDCHRFRFIRPLGAEKQESGYKSKKWEGVYPATSCAEWDGFVTWTAQCCRKDQTQTIIAKSLARS